MIDKARLEKIRERANKATMGRWLHRRYVLELSELGKESLTRNDFIQYRHEIETEWIHGQSEDVVHIVSMARSPFFHIDVWPYIREEDAEFLAHARQDIPYLLEIIDKLLENE